MWIVELCPRSCHNSSVMCGANGAKTASKFIKLDLQVPFLSSIIFPPSCSLILKKELVASIIAATAVLNLSLSISLVTFLIALCEALKICFSISRSSSIF